MKRVLVLNHFAKPSSQPGGNRHLDLFSRMDGWDARVLAADRNNMTGERQGRGVAAPFVFLPTIAGRRPVVRILGWVSYAVGAVMRGAVGQRPHVVYASSPHLLTGLAGAILARWWRVPFVLEIRDIWPRILVDMGGMSETSALYRSLRRLEVWLYRRADRVVHLAAGNADYLAEQGADPHGLVFVPNSVAPTEASIDRATSCQRYGFHGLTAIYTGAHGAANGLHLVLDACEVLLSEHPELEVVLVGDGPQKPALRKEAQRRSLTNLRFVDPVPKAELPDLYVGADIGLHVLDDIPLFRHGVSPNKVMDYLAAGLPVITNSPGEVGDLVTDADAGVVCEPLELTDGLRRMLAHTELERSTFGSDGRDYVDHVRNPGLMAARLKLMLDELTGE